MKEIIVRIVEFYEKIGSFFLWPHLYNKFVSSYRKVTPTEELVVEISFYLILIWAAIKLVRFIKWATKKIFKKGSASS